MKHQVREILTNPKAAAGVSGFSFTSGLALVFEISPKVLGVLGSLAGLILSLTMLYLALARHRWEKEKHDLEMGILNDKRQWESRQRFAKQESESAVVATEQGSGQSPS